MVRPLSVRSRARLCVSWAFLVHGLVLGTWAPRIPAIVDRLSIDAGELGLALAGLALAFVAGARAASWLIDRLGSAAVVRAFAVVIAVALIGPALAGSLATLTLSLVALGAAGGVLDVAMNLQAVLVERRERRPLMSGFHALWSVGSMLGALGAVAAARLDVGVRAHFAVVAVLLAALSLLLLRGPLEPDPHPSSPEARVEPGHRRRWSLPAVGVVLGLMGFSSFLAEGSAADWSALYLRQGAAASAAVASAGFAVFEGAMAAVRFGGNRLTARFGPVRLVRAAGLIAAAGLLVSLAAGNPYVALLGLAAFGAGIGPVVPTVFSAAGNLRVGREGAVLSPVLTMSYLGAIVGPAAIGLTADHSGLRWALLIPAGLAVAIAAGARSVSTAAGSRPPSA
jgi:MFS family permease